MKKLVVAIASALACTVGFAERSDVSTELDALRNESKQLQKKIDRLERKVGESSTPSSATSSTTSRSRSGRSSGFHRSSLSVHALDGHPESMGFYPTALEAEGHIVTYIAGTPVVSSPYLGDRPAFDGSDYIVNISSINRDVRLMQQRRRLYRAYEKIGYPIPSMPIIAVSGKAEPFAFISSPYVGSSKGDLSLGASELDFAAALNENVEAFISIAYDDSPAQIDGPRVSNTRFFLNMGFVNIGNLDKTPFYFTAGQLFAPFGRYSSAMISASLPMRLGRTKTRPVILGYKTQHGSGPYAAVYGFRSETTLGRSGAGGINAGYTFSKDKIIGEIGASYISSLSDSGGLQYVGSQPRSTFGGFSSIRNGSERVRKVPGFDVHGNISFDSFSLTAEWVTATSAFPSQDLSFNMRGAKPQAGQLEVGHTFMAFDRPASVGAGYQWSRDALAIALPKQSLSAVFNISIWKDTVESIEYRHDKDYACGLTGNGIPAPGRVNAPVVGTGRSADTLSAQIGVYF